MSFPQSTVTSMDGTKIGYYSIGQGPGIMVPHGALRTSNDFTKFSQALSDSFTVHVIDRRGRGMSGPQGADYSISKECEDVEAVQEATGATYVFGHSYGGLVALEFARENKSINKIALYEPGIIAEPTNWDWMSDYEMAMGREDFRGAFASFVRGMGHTSLTHFPLWYAKLLLRLLADNIKKRNENIWHL